MPHRVCGVKFTQNENLVICRANVEHIFFKQEKISIVVKTYHFKFSGMSFLNVFLRNWEPLMHENQELPHRFKLIDHEITQFVAQVHTN